MIIQFSKNIVNTSAWFHSPSLAATTVSWPITSVRICCSLGMCSLASPIPYPIPSSPTSVGATVTITMSTTLLRISLFVLCEDEASAEHSPPSPSLSYRREILSSPSSHTRFASASIPELQTSQKFPERYGQKTVGHLLVLSRIIESQSA